MIQSGRHAQRCARDIHCLQFIIGWQEPVAKRTSCIRARIKSRPTCAVSNYCQGIRVDRTSGSDEPLEHAAAALQSGEMVALMPQGTIPRGLEFFNPQLQGRWGAARLAVQTNATVIPIGLWGTEKVWPRSAKLPDMLNLSNPPLVSITVGAPVELDRSGNSAETIAANTQAIMNAISNLLPDESREQRVPTDAELRATFPSSYSGDLRADTTRRPGTD